MYRCRQCGHKEYGGCIPLRGCSLFPLLLVAVSSCLWFGCVTGVRLWVLPAPPPDAPEPAIPWWLWPIGCVVELVVFVGTAVALGYVLTVAETIWMLRSKCETCGARSWLIEESDRPGGWGL